MSDREKNVSISDPLPGELLQFALDVTELGFWDLNIKTQTAHRSLRHDQIFGYQEPVAEWTFQRFIGHIDERDRADVEEQYSRALATGGSWHFRCRIHRTDGKLRWIEARGRHLHDVEDNPTHIVGTVADITERVEAEQKYERLLQEKARLVEELQASGQRQTTILQATEQHFRLLVEGVQDYAIFMLDPMGYVATWNAGAQRFKGYKPEEIIGQHFSRFYTQEDIAARHPWRELEIAEREGRYEEEGWRVRQDGSHFFANVIITALRGSEGRLSGFAKVTHDVTEKRKREQERSLAQNMRQQRRFLKQVLSSVTEGRFILCDTPEELPSAAALPAFSGMPIPLTEHALKTVRQEVAQVAASCGLPLNKAQDLITASSECAMNAVVHGGGGTARVEGDPDHKRVRVRVEDKGRGIDLENLPRATLEPGYSTGGSGIGHGFNLMLSCCQKVYLLTGATGTTVVLEQGENQPFPAWII